MLNILLRVEDFPIQSLAHLPRGIIARYLHPDSFQVFLNTEQLLWEAGVVRKVSISGLSHADILHVDKATGQRRV